MHFLTVYKNMKTFRENKALEFPSMTQYEHKVIVMVIA